MKVVIAIDSFKGSMTSMEAGNAAKSGVLRACPSATVIVKPLADGGEGTTEAMMEGFGGEEHLLQVTGPMGNPVTAMYAYLSSEQTVIMEMASAAGITLIPGEKNPLKATTYGVGEMIRDAIEKGYRKFIVGIGGSATNDGGMGMLQALGYEFLDENGVALGLGAEALFRVAKIDGSKVLPELKDCSFRVACDVKNPLCGPRGATYVFGPQKGVTEEMRADLDAAMARYARIVEEYLGGGAAGLSTIPGTGAAGGLGFAFLAFLHAQLTPGIALILDAIQLEEELKDADYVLTGEGRLDGQTAMGKVPVGVAKLAKKYGCKVLAFAGAVTPEAKECNDQGIDAFFPIVRGVTTLEQAMNTTNAVQNMTDTVEQVFRLL
ncbi:MAG: glycerate kinase [Lachnospiraceae bacterium]|nr:glycerate kinase [Lachnospiraceae bacterium]